MVSFSVLLICLIDLWTFDLLTHCLRVRTLFYNCLMMQVHRSVQILRDKQELAEAQKELAKFQVTQETSKKKENVPTPSLSEPKKLEENPDTSGQQLALVLPHQVNSASIVPRASEPVQQHVDQPVQQPACSSLVPQQDRYVLRQAIVYYPQRQAPGVHDTQGQQVQPEVQYLPTRPPPQDAPVHASPQQPQTANQTQSQNYPPYQQPWHQQPSQPTPAPVAQSPPTYSQSFPQPTQQPQAQLTNVQQYPPPPVQPQQSSPQLPPQAMQPQHPPVQTQMRPQTHPNYPQYAPHQPLNPTPELAESLPGNAALQGQYNAVASSGGSRSEVPYSYGGPGIPPPQPPLQYNMQRHQLPPSQGSFGPPPIKGSYAGPQQYAPQGNPQGYNTSYGYAPSSASAAPAAQMPPGGVGMSHPGSHMMRDHPHREVIEKAVILGYPRDQVLNVIQRMTESGQPMDFNTLLDRLNEAGPGAPPRPW
jgi:hypothetical protein